jgi:endonuclease YncB( thermonuclease family)
MQPFSKAAKQFSTKKVYNQNVLVEPEYYDKYKRMVAVVRYGDTILNGELVRAGFAWVYTHFCHKDICDSWEQMENSARDAGRGLWRDKRPVPPWQWKRMNHSN